jgi:hypothetical protein
MFAGRKGMLLPLYISNPPQKSRRCSDNGPQIFIGKGTTSSRERVRSSTEDIDCAGSKQILTRQKKGSNHEKDYRNCNPHLAGPEL